MLQTKYGVSLVLAIFLLIFAVPRLPATWEADVPMGFTLLWLAFAHMVVVANWRMIIQADKNRRVQDERERRSRWLKHQRKAPTPWLDSYRQR